MGPLSPLKEKRNHSIREKEKISGFSKKQEISKELLEKDG
jgi:hypothetical protein